MSPSGSLTTVATMIGLSNITSPAPESTLVTFNSTPLSSFNSSHQLPSLLSSSVTDHSVASMTEYLAARVGSNVNEVPSGEKPDPRTTNLFECVPYKLNSGWASTTGSGIR